MKFSKKESYRIAYNYYGRTLVSDFDYMGNRGPLYHFFSNSVGTDIYLSKTEAKQAIEKAQQMDFDRFSEPDDPNKNKGTQRSPFGL